MTPSVSESGYSDPCLMDKVMAAYQKPVESQEIHLKILCTALAAWAAQHNYQIDHHLTRFTVKKTIRTLKKCGLTEEGVKRSVVGVVASLREKNGKQLEVPRKRCVVDRVVDAYHEPEAMTTPIRTIFIEALNHWARKNKIITFDACADIDTFIIVLENAGFNEESLIMSCLYALCSLNRYEDCDELLDRLIRQGKTYKDFENEGRPFMFYLEQKIHRIISDYENDKGTKEQLEKSEIDFRFCKAFWGWKELGNDFGKASLAATNFKNQSRVRGDGDRHASRFSGSIVEECRGMEFLP